jgi:hypothetical protein
MTDDWRRRTKLDIETRIYLQVILTQVSGLPDSVKIHPAKACLKLPHLADPEIFHHQHANQGGQHQDGA